MKTMTEMREMTEKRVGELTDTVRKAAKGFAGTAQRTAHAVVGAPLVAGRKLANLRGRLAKTARDEFETWADEGEKVTTQLRDRKVLIELRERVDFDHIQGRVEKLRDQLEDVLSNWRESFMPQSDEASPPAAPVADEPTAKKATAKKPAAKKPAAKKATAKKPAAKAAPKA